MNPVRKRWVKLLDFETDKDGEEILLDGKGRRLVMGKDPVYLLFFEGQLQTNSKGRPYTPQYIFPPRRSC